MASKAFVARRKSILGLEGAPEIAVSTLLRDSYLYLVFRRELGMPQVVMVTSTAYDDPIHVGDTSEHRELMCFSCIVTHGSRSWIVSWPKPTSGGPSVFSVNVVG